MVRRPRVPIILAIVLAQAWAAFALEARVTELQVSASRLALVIELRDLLRDTFLETVQQGRAVFLQVQTELWEDRRIADRLVFTRPELIYRIDRAAARGVTLTDQYGNRSSHEEVTAAVLIGLDMGSVSSLVDDRSYYARAQVTAATVAERDIDRIGAAIFGDDQSAAGLANLGRYLFGSLLRIGRYLESASADVTSPRYTGLQIRTGAR